MMDIEPLSKFTRAVLVGAILAAALSGCIAGYALHGIVRWYWP